MAKIPLGSMMVDDLARLVSLESRHAAQYPWEIAAAPVDEEATVQLRYLTGKLARMRPTTLNAATLWARAVYPLLELAETETIRAWAEVSIAAKDPYSETELAGVVDGVLAPEGVLAGAPGQPFLLVMQAKRGVGATDPRPALLAGVVAVLWTKMAAVEAAGRAEVFGCFTASDTWMFVRAEAAVRPEGQIPRLAVTLSWSREYAERAEAGAILGMLRGITGGPARV
jgi:hypothetical protein